MTHLRNSLEKYLLSINDRKKFVSSLVNWPAVIAQWLNNQLLILRSRVQFQPPLALEIDKSDKKSFVKSYHESLSPANYQESTSLEFRNVT